MALEDFKWQNKREELSFLEAGQHLRSLNQQLWQVPGMAIAVTGGIWYGAASISNDLAKILVLLFALSVDILTIVVLLRLRNVIQTQIDLQNKFSSISTGKGRVVVRCWSTLLAIAALLSLIATFNTEKISITKSSPLKPSTNNYLYYQKLEITQK